VREGEVRCASSARVRGSVKAHRGIVVEPGAAIGGALIAALDVDVGAHSVVRGPVIADRDIDIGTGCRLGSSDMTTSVVAPDIRVAPGAIVFGTVWARRKGLALSEC